MTIEWEIEFCKSHSELNSQCFCDLWSIHGWYEVTNPILKPGNFDSFYREYCCAHTFHSLSFIIFKIMIEVTVTNEIKRRNSIITVSEVLRIDDKGSRQNCLRPLTMRQNVL